MNATDTLTLFSALPLLATGFGVAITGLLGCWLASGVASLVRAPAAEPWDYDPAWADEAYAV